MSKWDCIKTYSGVYFDLLDFKQEDIHIIDIAHALSHMCRYNGHCNSFYSVAEHCIRGSKIISSEAAPFFLLHDAAEAYLGDVVTPLKRMFPEYKEKEDMLLAMIFDKFIPTPYTKDIADKIKEMDRIQLEEEMEILLTATKPDFDCCDFTEIRQSFVNNFTGLQYAGYIKQ